MTSNKAILGFCFLLSAACLYILPFSPFVCTNQFIFFVWYDIFINIKLQHISVCLSVLSVGFDENTTNLLELHMSN